MDKQLIAAIVKDDGWTLTPDTLTYTTRQPTDDEWADILVRQRKRRRWLWA